jgi:hypothetical protein
VTSAKPTPLQMGIMELLQKGYSTGYIQATLKCARTTISKCKKKLQNQPPEVATPTDTRSQIIELLLTRLISGAPGAAAAASVLLKELRQEPPPSPDD